MPAAPPHRVRRVGFHVTTRSADTANEFHRRVGHAFEAELTGVLERTFDALAPTDTIHRIDRLEIDLGSIDRDRLEETLRQRLGPAIEEALALRIDRPPPTATSGESSLKSLTSLKESLPAQRHPSKDENDVKDKSDPRDPRDAAPKPPSPRHSSPLPTRALDALLHFLEHGHLPWWTPYATLPALEQAASPLNRHSNLIDRLQTLARTRLTVIQRLTQEFTNEFKQNLIETAATQNPSFREIQSEITAALRDPSRTTENPAPSPQPPASSIQHPAIQTLTLFALLRPTIRPVLSTLAESLVSFPPSQNKPLHNRTAETPFALCAFIEKEMAAGVPLSSVPAQKHPSRDEKDKRDARKPKDSNYSKDAAPEAPSPCHPVTLSPPHSYPSAAGSVLLHPFLVRLFENLDLIDKTRFPDDRARHKAVRLLAHLTWNQPDLPEHRLVIPKLLIGLDLDTPIENLPLTDAETAECATLLQNVITHWTALKNTTPDALRETFLQRPGKLEIDEQRRHLTVEQKPYDMLLAKLPWSIAIIKLPWMPRPLTVDWS